tara:strand:+ start:488 stop:1432 length:945 start_codon:yes stop_codon:yes gene_type:complete
MSHKIPSSYNVTNDAVIVIVDGESYTCKKGAANYESLRKAVLARNWADVYANLTVKSKIVKWTKGFMTVQGKDQLMYKGSAIDKQLNARIVEMAAKDENPIAFINFWIKLQKNPSARSVASLFGFLQHEGIPLDPDGNIIAYKSVTKDLKDHFTKKIDNTPGTINRMERNKVSDDPQTACHYGYHVGALKYASSFNRTGKIVICKIDPADVVCVPYDCSQRKMRACKYEVIGFHVKGQLLPSTVLKEDNEPVLLTKGQGAAWKEMDAMPGVELVAQTMATLRVYASKHLKLIGASSIPGGKDALVHAIVIHRMD